MGWLRELHLREIESKTMHKYKEGDQLREKKSKALSEVKPVQWYAMQRMWGNFFGICQYFEKMCQKNFQT